MTKILLMHIDQCSSCPFLEEGMRAGVKYFCINERSPQDNIVVSEEDHRLGIVRDKLSEIPEWCPIEDPKPGFYRIEIPIMEE